ncbi:MAG TPA: hypothetical protein VGP57_18875, partial [Actinoplanes sp.]|nr:hypothetical protein [Actinoplanes sp.]
MGRHVIGITPIVNPAPLDIGLDELLSRSRKAAVKRLPKRERATSESVPVRCNTSWGRGQPQPPFENGFGDAGAERICATALKIIHGIGIMPKQCNSD